MKNAGFTLVELILVIVIIALLSFILLPSQLGYDGVARRASCANNLKQFGVAFKMYSSEWDGKFPPIQTWMGDNCDVKNTFVLMFNGPALWPEYLTDANILVCPSDSETRKRYDEYSMRTPAEPGGSRRDGFINPCLFDDSSYYYTGWALYPDADLNKDVTVMPKPLIEGFRNMVTAESAYELDKDWSYTDAYGEEHQIYRIREGIEREFLFDGKDWSYTYTYTYTYGGGGYHIIGNGIEVATDSNRSIQSQIAIMFDRFDSRGEGLWHHEPHGINVLYMDGHVKSIRYPGRYPCNDAWPELADAVKRQ